MSFDYTGRSVERIRAIIVANRELTEARRRLWAAVSSSRAAGDTWVAIGRALNVTPQAANQRFKQK